MSLVLYVLTGGADYGAGVWTLLTRRRAHRAVIDKAIAPIWEANHVWLILVVTILFAGFPPAFALITTVLHVPLTVLLIGIVLRGSAFVFRTHDAGPRSKEDASQAFWTRVFAASSIVAPLMLGTTIGAVAADISLSVRLRSLIHSSLPGSPPFPFWSAVLHWRSSSISPRFT
jgi:cytochrome d ubiquinol oxidase subunit II